MIAYILNQDSVVLNRILHRPSDRLTPPAGLTLIQETEETVGFIGLPFGETPEPEGVEP
jgi:hypothetical protein